MICDVCNTRMIVSYEVDYGDGDVRIGYICPHCGHTETVYK